MMTTNKPKSLNAHYPGEDGCIKPFDFLGGLDDWCDCTEGRRSTTIQMIDGMYIHAAMADRRNALAALPHPDNAVF